MKGRFDRVEVFSWKTIALFYVQLIDTNMINSDIFISLWASVPLYTDVFMPGIGVSRLRMNVCTTMTNLYI